MNNSLYNGIELDDNDYFNISNMISDIIVTKNSVGDRYLNLIFQNICHEFACSSFAISTRSFGMLPSPARKRIMLYPIFFHKNSVNMINTLYFESIQSIGATPKLDKKLLRAPFTSNITCHTSTTDAIGTTRGLKNIVLNWLPNGIL